ncbi:MAG: polysaccharide biosynthesis C-terminal domain-containing protein, partial [bacterium]|nr:polysaccharide biosynthesis C-terminal domain-containing protein [bacterium]
ISITPLLPIFIKEMPNVKNIYFIYILFVINTSISYYFSYKRNLIIADQKIYIYTLFKYLFYFVLNVLQIFILILTKNYILYLIIQIICTFLENLSISIRANRMYPYLKDKNVDKLDVKTKNEIVKNTKAMMMHKIGATVVNGTDNILLSKFVSLISVGLYSNYYLITSSLHKILSQVYSSALAIICNLCVSNNIDTQYKVFKKIDFLGYWLYSFSSVCLLCLFNPFINLWVGKEYIFNFNIVIILVINYYIFGMRKAVLAFREASGLFYKDRWKAIIEAIVNLVTSILLAFKFGTFGVFLGTLISSVTVCVWVEPYVLFKYGFKMNLWKYFKQYFKYLFVTVILGVITYFICSMVCFNVYISFLIKLIICIIVPNLLLILIFYRTDEFKYYFDLIKKILSKITKKCGLTKKVV